MYYMVVVYTIDNDVFDRVRMKLGASKEGVLAHYSFGLFSVLDQA